MWSSWARACGARRCAIISWRGSVRPREPRTASALHVFGQCAHRFRRHFHAFAAIDLGFGEVDGGENISTAPFAFDPQSHRRPHRVLGAFKPPAVDGAADEFLLFRRKAYLHCPSIAWAASKASSAGMDDEPAQISFQIKIGTLPAGNKLGVIARDIDGRDVPRANLVFGHLRGRNLPIATAVSAEALRRELEAMRGAEQGGRKTAARVRGR